MSSLGGEIRAALSELWGSPRGSEFGSIPIDRKVLLDPISFREVRSRVKALSPGAAADSDGLKKDHLVGDLSSRSCWAGYLTLYSVVRSRKEIGPRRGMIVLCRVTIDSYWRGSVENNTFFSTSRKPNSD